MFVTPPNTIRIRTASFAFASVPGSGTAGATDLHLFTPDGEPNYVTFLTPLGVGQINATTSQVMAQAGDVPHEGQYPFAVPGAIRKGEGTKTFFGQEYDRAAIEALGVLLIRENLLDHGLIETYSAMTGVSIQQASNQYYSSTNMKTRLDVIRSLADVSSLSGERKKSC
ncbi:hypothetical protein [Sphingomonas sp. PP-CE-1G-424]|uniref:hypothetical protein n=1 Tax=Sphingomonas sp. PP-CE-1G-424 TaxID=2135658 RepID=UPI001056BAAE|nr:hypothetical protein [Sphingomonas sp. PP-CE-1G-424]TCP67440.1 hypothetical protein C8J43_10380 [Sphingomonas sp. PP-CE-1G-424]